MRIVRVFGPALLVLHLILRVTHQSFWTEVLLYNLIGIFAIISITLSPKVDFFISKIAISLGILAWVLGSIIASFAHYNFATTLLTSFGELMYLVFYPFIVIGSVRMIRGRTSYKGSEVLDSAIIGFGITTFGTTFVLPQVLPSLNQNWWESFYAFTYPLADLMLIAIVLPLLFIRRFSSPYFLLVIGISIFAATDFFYLSLDNAELYSVGTWIDDGWLLGILVISESFWHADSKQRISQPLITDSRTPIFISVPQFLHSMRYNQTIFPAI